MKPDPLTKLTKAKLLDLYLGEQYDGDGHPAPQIVIDAMRWTKDRLIRAIKRARRSRHTQDERLCPKGHKPGAPGCDLFSCWVTNVTPWPDAPVYTMGLDFAVRPRSRARGLRGGAVVASKAANHAWMDDILTPYKEIDSVHLQALAENYRGLDKQFAVDTSVGWWWRIPRGWWLAFTRWSIWRTWTGPR